MKKHIRSNENKRRRNTGGEVRYRVTREELAALELLRSTGLGVLEAAQVACAAVRAAGGGLERTLQCIAQGAVEQAKQEHTVSLATAAWASVDARIGRRESTRRDLRHFVRRMLRVEGAGELPLRGMTADDCRRVLGEAFSESVHSYRKGRAILHSIFSYGQRQGWCVDNPGAAVEVPPVVEHEIVPLTVEEVERLELAVTEPQHADMSLSLYLMTYCGLRPAEVSRLRPEDISYVEKQVVVRPAVSKTGGGRVVPLRRVGRLRGVQRIIPRNWENRWRALRRAAGFQCWQPDVLRHTFATYHLLHFRNLPELQLEMGHANSNLLRTRYTNLPRANRAASSQFWGG